MMMDERVETTRIETIIEKLADRNLRIVANKIGVSPQTVYKFVKRKQEWPSYKLIRKLEVYLGQD
jgi:transposase